MNQLFRRPSAWILVVFLLVAIALYYFSHVAFVKINITTAKTTLFKIYWANERGHYAEKQSKIIRVFKDKKNYTFTIPHIADVRRIRIDPTSDNNMFVRLRSFALYQDGFERIRIDTPKGFERIRVLQDIAMNEIDKAGLRLRTTGPDSQLELSISPVRTRGTYVANFFRLIFIGLLTAFVVYLLKTRPAEPETA